MRKLLAGLTGFLIVLAVAGYIYEQRSAAADAAAWPAPGRIITVDGIDMHIDCRGEGRPTVILEAGLMSGSPTWVMVHDQLAAQTRTCAYDRPDLAWSSGGEFDPHVAAVAARLHTLLEAADIDGDKIIVGMSAGGVHVREYVARFPDDIVGMVLVDSSHEQQIARLPASDEVSRMETMMAVCAALQPFGAVRFGHALDALILREGMRPEHAALMKASYYRPGSCAAVARESKTFTSDLARNLAPRSLGDLPLLVISQGKPPADDETSGRTKAEVQAFRDVWDQLQLELTALSSSGRRIIATQSGHVIQLEQPQIVVEGILSLLAEVRATSAAAIESLPRDQQ